ncbi:VTC domain-containing protein [Clostridium sartagoforme]|uniref:VTC domain-containing protein n=1 Tax=Clostridium sartagoforme TaxID=84031 RepID=UPI0012FBDF5C|nr:VTC domain-containing protein [Clostridium sartagoforme]
MEKKYEMPYIVSRKLKSTLEVALKPDINNKENGYMVRSLYFDTIFDNDYMDKEDGIEYRKKLRLRTYDLDSNILKLELKEKRGRCS